MLYLNNIKTTYLRFKEYWQAAAFTNQFLRTHSGLPSQPLHRNRCNPENIRCYHREKPNLPKTMKPTSCRPPQLSLNCLFNDSYVICLVRKMISVPRWYSVVNLWVSMVVADGLAPIWCQVISNHHDDVERSVDLRRPPKLHKSYDFKWVTLSPFQLRVFDWGGMGVSFFFFALSEFEWQQKVNSHLILNMMRKKFTNMVPSADNLITDTTEKYEVIFTGFKQRSDTYSHCFH